MLIGIDASRGVMPRSAGVGRYSRELIAAMAAAAGHRLRLYANGAARPAWALGDNIEWRDLPWPRLWTHSRLAWEVFHHPPEALFVPAHVLPVAHPDASVVTVHDLGYLRFPECHPPRQRFYLRLSTRWNTHSSAAILADSHATKADLTRLLGVQPHKVSVAYPGVSSEFAPIASGAVQAVRLQYGLPDRYLLYVGTLQPRKNIARLLAAHAQVTQAPLLAMAGAPGWLSDDLVRRVDASGPRVKRLGFVPDEHLPALMTGAVALLLPSLYEGFGMPVLEAMACGTPVLASRTSSLPEIVGEAGVMVDPLSIESIVDGLRRLCNDADLARSLRQAGLERARIFTWSACAGVALQVIEAAHAQ
jgi:glycosyltransferase involved in cell wall biosynthesis